MAFKKIEKVLTIDNGDIYYEFEDNEYQILYIQPANDRQSNLINYSFTGPTILIFPDEKTNFVGLRNMVEDYGLKQIAQENGTGIILINPPDNTWKNEIQGAYETIINNLGVAQMNFYDGLAVMRNESMPDEQGYNILGSCVRMYVYGFGSGADYLARHYLRKLDDTIMVGDLGLCEITPVCITLKGLSILPEPEKNDINIVSIGNTPQQNAVLTSNCGDVLMQDDFNLKRDYRAYVGNYCRWNGKITRAFNYEAEGIVVKPESVIVAKEEDDEGFRKGRHHVKPGKHKVGYVTFYNKDIDVTYTKHPLLLVFHGEGDSAIATAQWGEWPLIGKEEGFVTVAVEMQTRVSANEVMSLIDHLCKEYAIDEERIYATGFSKGAMKCWDLMQWHRERFAGLMPMGSADYRNSYFSTENSDEKGIVPLFYSGGVSSPYIELPCHDDRAIERMKSVARINNLYKTFELEEGRERWEDTYLGCKGDWIEVLHDQMFPQSDYVMNYYSSNDDRRCTCLMVVTGQGHEIRPFANRLAYRFIKRFSRKDGQIVIEE